MLAAHDHFALGVARGDGKGLGRMTDHFHDEIFVHAHVGAVHKAARLLQQRHGLGVQKLNPDVTQDAHRTLVNRLHAIGVHRLDGAVGVNRDTPRHLIDNGRACPNLVARPSPGAAALACCGIIGHLRLHRDSPPLGFWPR